MDNFKLEKKYLYWGGTAFLVVVACIAFFWVIQRWDGVKNTVADINAIFAPFIMGFVIAYFLTPVVKFLQNRAMDPAVRAVFKKNPKRAATVGRGLAVAVSLLLFIGLITAMIMIIFPQLYRSIESIVLNIQTSIDKVEAWANKWLEDYPQIEMAFTEFVGDIGDEFSNWARNTLLPQMNNVLTSVSVGVYNIFRALANFLIAIVISVYLMHSREKFIAQAKKLLYSIFNVEHSNKILRVLRFTDKSFMQFFSGKLLDSLIIGIICYIGCRVIGIKDSVLISFIIGITNIIPFFGPLIGAIPSALIVLMYSPVQCLIFVLFIIVLQQFDGNILGPKILGSATGLSGFWVMFAILVGAGILGPLGMIIGVPLFAVIYAALKYFVRNQLKKRGLPLDTNIYASIDHINPKTQEAVTIKPQKAGIEETRDEAFKSGE